MKQFFPILIFTILLSTNLTAQLDFLNGEPATFTSSKSGFDAASLSKTTMLVEQFAATGSNCSDKPVQIEVGFSIAPVVDFCPNKKMTKAEKKKLAKFDAGLSKRLSAQTALWKDYQQSYEIVSADELDAPDYSDKNKYRYVMRYKYVAASNGNNNLYFATRYYLYDRLEDKEYTTLGGLNTTTDLKKVSNLKKVVSKLNKA